MKKDIEINITNITLNSKPNIIFYSKGLILRFVHFSSKKKKKKEDQQRFEGAKDKLELNGEFSNY